MHQVPMHAAAQNRSTPFDANAAPFWEPEALCSCLPGYTRQRTRLMMSKHLLPAASCTAVCAGTAGEAQGQQKGHLLLRCLHIRGRWLTSLGIHLGVAVDAEAPNGQRTPHHHLQCHRVPLPCKTSCSSYAHIPHAPLCPVHHTSTEPIQARQWQKETPDLCPTATSPTMQLAGDPRSERHCCKISTHAAFIQDRLLWTV